MPSNSPSWCRNTSSRSRVHIPFELTYPFLGMSFTRSAYPSRGRLHSRRSAASRRTSQRPFHPRSPPTPSSVASHQFVHRSQSRTRKLLPSSRPVPCSASEDASPLPFFLSVRYSRDSAWREPPRHTPSEREVLSSPRKPFHRASCLAQQSTSFGLPLRPLQTSEPQTRSSPKAFARPFTFGLQPSSHPKVRTRPSSSSSNARHCGAFTPQRQVNPLLQRVTRKRFCRQYPTLFKIGPRYLAAAIPSPSTLPTSLLIN